MISLFHYTHLAIHHLMRGGQRVLVALLCIAFGVMTLVAMTMIARPIESSINITPAELLGGDLSAGRQAEAALRPEDLAQLEGLQHSGEISDYTLIAFNSSIMFRSAGSSEMRFVGNAMGIEPDNYPLAGVLTIGEPGRSNLADLLQNTGDVIVTRDVAEAFDLTVGDAIILTDLRAGVPVSGIVRAVAYDTPNHRGDKIYYSVQTAQALANGQPFVNTVIINTPTAAAVIETLESSGWSVDWAAGERGSQAANVWVLGLRGAGILGLLVGGIGIANTMQVLLRRRQREIAIWKTLGYREGHLHLIFSLEAALLGLLGSILGAGLGVLISGTVLEMFRRTSTLLYEWSFSMRPPLTGIVVGTLTTVIFAYWAIVMSSQVKPMALLRNERIEARRLVGCRSIALVLLLAVPFTGLISLVMKSIIAGISVLVCIVIGLAMLGVFFSIVLWISTCVIPLRRFPLAQMAFNSLRRRGLALIFAMIALFIGVLSMTSGLAVAQKSAGGMSGPSGELPGYNLTILAGADQESAVRQAVEALHPEKASAGYRTELASLSVVGGESVYATDAVLVGRADPDDYLISGAKWGSQPDGVYVNRAANLAAGSQVEVTFRDGTTRIFNVVGSYEVNHFSFNLYPPTGLLMTAEGFARAAEPDSLIYSVRVAPDQVGDAASALGISLPQATVINLIAYAGRFMRSYQNLYVLPMALAAMAMLAGFLLLANTVSLAMLDRRYEIGVLKTVGYTRRQILSIFAVEYGLIGLIATGTGVLVMQGLLALVAIASHVAANAVLLGLPALTLIALCGVGLTLLVVCGVTWKPTRLSPVVILNERG
jgi:putative ABC transport system permease protein